jgi:ribosomal protein S27E
LVEGLNVEKVQKTTRAGKAGKDITCPACSFITTVYHFAWSALSCQRCEKMIDKYDWYLESQ